MTIEQTISELDYQHQQAEPQIAPEPEPIKDADPEVVREKPITTPDETPDSDKEAATSETDNEEQTSEEPKYQPNYKYNVAQKELEFDERLRAIIKDKDSEDYVRDLVTRAEGLDLVKQRLSEKDNLAKDLQSRYGEIQTEHESYKKGISRLTDLAKNDLHSFRRAWNITDEQIVRLANDIINETENPVLAQQRQAAFDNQIKSWQMEDQNLHTQTRHDSSVQELHEMRMEIAMSKPDVNEFQKSLDALRGEGFFEKKVKEYGTLKYHQGEYVLPKDAVNYVMEEYGVFLKAQNEQKVSQQASSVPSDGNPAVVRDAKPIPNLGTGRTGSPVRQKPSWELLKKLAGEA